MCLFGYVHRQTLESHTAGDVPVEVAAVRGPCITRSALAVPGYGVGDGHRASLQVLHLVGPLPVADGLFSPVVVADVDWILSSVATGTQDAGVRVCQHTRVERRRRRTLTSW